MCGSATAPGRVGRCGLESRALCKELDVPGLKAGLGAGRGARADEMLLGRLAVLATDAGDTSRCMAGLCWRAIQSRASVQPGQWVEETTESQREPLLRVRRRARRSVSRGSCQQFGAEQRRAELHARYDRLSRSTLLSLSLGVGVRQRTSSIPAPQRERKLPPLLAGLGRALCETATIVSISSSSARASEKKRERKRDAPCTRRRTSARPGCS